MPRAPNWWRDLFSDLCKTLHLIIFRSKPLPKFCTQDTSVTTLHSQPCLIKSFLFISSVDVWWNYSFICVSLMINDVEYIVHFHMFTDHFDVLFCELSIQDFCPILIVLAMFPVINYLKFFLHILPASCVWFFYCRYLLLLWLSFLLLNGFF